MKRYLLVTTAIIFLFPSPVILFGQTGAPLRSIADRFYIEGQAGISHPVLFFGALYFSTNLHLSAGYRFSEKHSLGATRTSFSNALDTHFRNATGIGFQYRYQHEQWSFDSGGGYIVRNGYSTDGVGEYSENLRRSDRWYFRIGLQQHFLRFLTIGLSYAHSGKIAYDFVPDDMPSTAYTRRVEGMRTLTLNLGVLIQTQP